MEDVAKVPLLPEETRIQRVGIYLNDLKDRLRELRLQHDEVIQNSIDIIKEIDKVSSSLLLTQTDERNETITNIKKLIQEFETSKEAAIMAKRSVSIERKIDIRILQNFEKLNDSHILQESLLLFKRAKKSFEKIDGFFGETAMSTSLRDKTKLFTCADNNPSIYASCCSLVSLDTFHSSLEFGNTINSVEKGYEGDNDDSEYDLLAMKEKKE